MATVPVEDTLAVGDKITASWANSDVRDAANFLLAPPRVSLTMTTPTNLPTSGTSAVLTWDTETYDSDGMHSTVTNTSRLVAVTAGLYAVSATIAFASNVTGVRTVDLRKNAAGSSVGGTRIIFGSALAVTGSTVTTVPIATDVQMSANDYLEFFGNQTSGGALSLSGVGLTNVTMRWVASS